jgi:hypothetical protein
MSAIFSPCRTYRYRLTRRWGSGPNARFIMLNPSTADENVDDPTIRRCIAFAKREGCGGLVVVNLFAFRATDPRELAGAINPCGPDADRHLMDAIQDADGPLIAAWGSNAFAKQRAADVTAMIGAHCVCLGKTKDGHPRHPLYVKGDAPLVPLIVDAAPFVDVFG